MIEKTDFSSCCTEAKRYSPAWSAEKPAACGKGPAGFAEPSSRAFCSLERCGTARADVGMQAIEYMENLLMQGRRDEFFEELQKRWCAAERAADTDGVAMMELYFSVSLVLLRCMARTAKETNTETAQAWEPMKFVDFSHWSEAYEHIVKTANSLMGQSNARKESYEIHLLKYVKQYVDKHAYDRVSLTDIANYTKYNPAYISRIFKKHNGVTLCVYINQVRMNKAKEMLAQSSLSVCEIASRAGFESPQYFATVFRKNTGFSPKQYRLANGKGC